MNSCTSSINGASAQAFCIRTDTDKCVGCNRCIRVCPIETANIAYQDEAGDIKVRLDSSQCILCGACVEICEHSARHIQDDTDRFFTDLQAGVPIAVMAAPSIQTVLPHWKQLFSWLRRQGVSAIYDVSLGADICVWAHLRLLGRAPGPLITQPCPVIVSYCERHRHALLPYLSPVHSPMACTAIIMRQAGVTGRIASISPCIAKAQEHQSTGCADYSLTFRGIACWLEQHGIALPMEEATGFDHPSAGAGRLFPLPGGLQENLQLLADRPLHIEKAEGRSVFKYLEQYAQTPGEFLPDVFDVLNCADGCMIGPGAPREQSVFQLNKKMQGVRAQAAAAVEQSRAALAAYDQQLRLEDFLRGYTPVPQKHVEVTEEEIHKAFALMHKHDFSQQHFNCGACGSESCRDMARKIALQVNLPTNCVIFSRDEAKQERERNAEYLALVRNIGDTLFDTQDDEYAAQVQNALRLLSESTRCSAVAIWSITGGAQQRTCTRVNGWYGDNPARIAIYGDWPADWIARLETEEYILANAKRDKPGLFSEAVTTLFIVPIHIRGQFWGFVDAVSEEDRSFSSEEASLLEATGILLISGILERELNRSLVLAKEDALAGTRAKSDFLSRMSHEIRTPMNAIIGMTRMGQTAQDSARKDYCLEKISGASTHLLGVINDILDMSKIEADKFELSSVWFSFERMLQDAAGVIAFRINEKRQQFSMQLDPNIPALLEGDDQRLTQVLTNLLSNASKFTPEGGHIRLTATLEQQQGSVCTIRVAVTDTGIGISPADQARLFQSFEQAESGTARKFGGTGLGLAISRRIVELMGGRIWVESAPGEGSTFQFTFQAEGRTEAPVSSAEPAADPAADDGCFKEYCVLFAEDIDINREIFTALLEATGLRIDHAENGRVALEKFQAAPEKYQLILMDLQMPDMDGYSATTAIRALPFDYAKRIPIIAMTANVFREDIDKCLSVGMNDHIGKPIDYDALMDKLRQYLK